MKKTIIALSLILGCDGHSDEARKYQELATAINPIIARLRQGVSATLALDHKQVSDSEMACIATPASTPDSDLTPQIRAALKEALVANRQFREHDSDLDELSKLAPKINALDLPVESGVYEIPVDSHGTLVDHTTWCMGTPSCFRTLRCADFGHQALISLVADIEALRAESKRHDVDILSLSP